MAKRSGSAGQVVEPTGPDEPQDSVPADPGEVSENQAGQGEEATPHQPDENRTGWIEIEMVDEDDNPVPGESYRITLPDGTVASGTLDEQGAARVEGFDSGSCQICFPNLDQDAWNPA